VGKLQNTGTYLIEVARHNQPSVVSTKYGIRGIVSNGSLLS
jgi:hypothetical protein